MKCEVVREGQACKSDAAFIVRTPWATQLVCEDCAASFKRYETQKLEFFCDWPVSGRECGEKATYYFEGDGHQRPLCADHAVKLPSSASVHSISDSRFNPKLVPYKPPAQPPPRITSDGLWCHCGKTGKFRPGVETMPLCDEHYTPPKFEQEVCGGVDREPLDDLTTVAAPPGDVRAALRDLALTTIRILKEKIEKWR